MNERNERDGRDGRDGNGDAETTVMDVVAGDVFRGKAGGPSADTSVMDTVSMDTVPVDTAPMGLVEADTMAIDIPTLSMPAMGGTDTAVPDTTVIDVAATDTTAPHTTVMDAVRPTATVSASDDAPTTAIATTPNDADGDDGDGADGDGTDGDNADGDNAVAESAGGSAIDVEGVTTDDAVGADTDAENDVHAGGDAADMAADPDLGGASVGGAAGSSSDPALDGATGDGADGASDCPASQQIPLYATQPPYNAAGAGAAFPPHAGGETPASGQYARSQYSQCQQGFGSSEAGRTPASWGNPAQPYVHVEPDSQPEQPVIRKTGPSVATIVFSVIFIVLGGALFVLGLRLPQIGWFNADPRVALAVGLAILGGIFVLVAIIWSLAKVVHSMRHPKEKADGSSVR